MISEFTTSTMARLVIVDDSAPVRTLLRLALTRDGHEIWEAGDGVAGWQLLLDQRPDVIILDVMMPGPSGLDVCRAIRADPRFAMLPVIILTANGLPESEAEAMDAGADCFLAKPFRPQVLLAAVERLAGGSARD